MCYCENITVLQFQIHVIAEAEIGAERGIRTHDLRINSPPLHQLSYLGSMPPTALSFMNESGQKEGIYSHSIVPGGL